VSTWIKAKALVMSMYTYTQTPEHKRRSEDEFQTFMVVHSEHILTLIIELVMQAFIIGALIGGVSFMAAAYARAVVRFTSVMWTAVQDEPTST
jgi:hypothetical protein